MKDVWILGGIFVGKQLDVHKMSNVFDIELEEQSDLGDKTCHPGFRPGLTYKPGCSTTDDGFRGWKFQF